jgi:hypothetical protein
MKHVASSALLASCSMLVPCWAYSPTMKIEATCSSESSVDFQRTAGRYIPEDRSLPNEMWIMVESEEPPAYTNPQLPSYVFKLEVQCELHVKWDYSSVVETKIKFSGNLGVNYL